MRMIQIMMKNPQAAQKALVTKLGCSPEEITIDEKMERVYVPNADRFHEILQQRKITELKNGGGYHFVLPIQKRFWKVTLYDAEKRVFEEKYVKNYKIHRRKTMPGAFY